MSELTSDGNDSSEPKYRDEQWLREKYESEEMTIYEIGELCGVTGQAIAKWMRRNGIKTRKGTRKQTRHAKTDLLLDEEWLETQYIDNERSLKDIGDECNVDQRTISKHLRKHNISVRPRVAFGREHPNWKGGYPYQISNWEGKREQAISEYNGKCVACGMSREEHRDEFNADLNVHHVTPLLHFEDVDKANELDNLIPLCNACHVKWEGIPLRPSVI